MGLCTQDGNIPNESFPRLFLTVSTTPGKCSFRFSRVVSIVFLLAIPLVEGAILELTEALMDKLSFLRADSDQVSL